MKWMKSALEFDFFPISPLGTLVQYRLLCVNFAGGPLALHLVRKVGFASDQ